MKRCLDRTDFTDMNSMDCSLENDDNTIQLGVNGYRMRLDRGQVQKLLPYLFRFVKDAHAERADREGITRDEAKLRDFYDAYIKCAVKETNLK